MLTLTDCGQTVDDAGTVFFGFIATGANPAGLFSGIARIGANGVGKSTIAGKLALEAVENREQPYYDTWLSVCQWFESARTASERPDDDERFRTERALTAHLVAVDLLILDELDKGMGTESKSRALQNLLIKREQFQRPTILLTNAHQAALAVLLGDALIDRLYRGGSVLELKWQSFRAEPAHA